MGVADRCHMTWEPKPRRWRKVYKGKTYTISCTELGVPETKEGSYQAANAWWDARKSAIDADQPPHPHAGLIGMLSRRRDWLARHGEEEEREEHNAEIRRIQHLGEGDDPFPEGHFEGLEGQRRMRQMVRDAAVWEDRLKRDRAGSVPVEKTLQALSTGFLSIAERKMRAGDLSASEMDTARRCVGHAVEFFGAGNEAGVIDADRLEAYWHHLRGLMESGQRSREYVKKDWRYAKSFIEWLTTMGKMDPPRNLHARHHKFGGSSVVIETFTVDEVKRLVDAAPGQTKLHLLLMLNCGMYQGDISDLRKDEVDLKNGTISRQRSKTRRHGDKVPTVTYRLWPCTLALLRRYVPESKDPILALTTRAGKSWVEPGMKGEKFTRRDGIKSNFAHIQRRLKITKPLKVFRKTSATMLDSNSEYARYAQFFLGHAGRTTAEIHYLNRGGQSFDDAVDWLRRQYGF